MTISAEVSYGNSTYIKTKHKAYNVCAPETVHLQNDKKCNVQRIKHKHGVVKPSSHCNACRATAVKLTVQDLNLILHAPKLNLNFH